jgi:hypothetical protein
MQKGFLPQSLRETRIPQLLFNRGSLGNPVRSCTKLVLRTQ